MAELSFRLILLFAAVVVCAGRTAAQDKDGDKECSTEIVNADCTVTIDRSYPVVLPTIQMRPGAVVKVRIVHSLPFETLSLDLQSAICGRWHGPNGSLRHSSIAEPERPVDSIEHQYCCRQPIVEKFDSKN